MGYQACKWNLNKNITSYGDFLKANFLTQVINVAFVLFRIVEA